MSIVRLLILSVLSVAAAIGAAEGAARLVGAESEPARFLAAFVGSRAFVRSDPALGFALVPGFEDDLYEINAAGFRGRPFPADLSERFTVLCAGDSTTFGWQVPEGGDFPAQLGRLLGARDGRETRESPAVSQREPPAVSQREPPAPWTWVVNGGVPSFTSTQVLRKVERDVAQLRPDVVVVTMPWNDLWYSSFSPWQQEVLVPRVPGSLRMWLLRHSAVFRILVRPPAVPLAVNRSAAEALDVFAANTAATVDTIRRFGAVPVFQTPPIDLDHVKPGGLRFAPTGLRWGRDFLVETARRYIDRFRQIGAAHDVVVAANPLSIEHLHQGDLFGDEIHPTVAGYARTAAALMKTLEAAQLIPGNLARPATR